MKPRMTRMNTKGLAQVLCSFVRIRVIGGYSYAHSA